MLQQVLEKQDKLEKAVQDLASSVQELVSILKFERTGADGEGKPAVQVVLPPVSPDLLSSILRTMRWSGQIYFPYFQTVTHVPAGTSVTFHLKLPEHYYCTCPGPLKFWSDYYDPAITFMAYVDGEPITPLTEIPMYPSGVIEMSYGGLWFKRQEVTVVYTNNSLRDANIAYGVEITMIRDFVYDEWYKPMIEFVKQRLSEMIVLGGGKPL